MLANDTVLLTTLRALEVETHQPQVRADGARLAQLMHPLFFEIGRSGKVYSRAAVLAEFRDRPPACRIWAQDFRIDALTEQLALLTYRSAHANEDGALERPTLRVSLWQLTDQQWQLRFHQGTPTEAFDKHST